MAESFFLQQLEEVEPGAQLNVSKMLDYRSRHPVTFYSAIAFDDSSSPDEILQAMDDAVSGVISTTFSTEAPEVLFLAAIDHAHISSRRISDDSERTILEYFVSVNSYIRSVEVLPESTD